MVLRHASAKETLASTGLNVDAPASWMIQGSCKASLFAPESLNDKQNNTSKAWGELRCGSVTMYPLFEVRWSLEHAVRILKCILYAVQVESLPLS